MITIYKNTSEIPQGMELIMLNDIFFNKRTVERLDERAKNIINQIDGANMIGKYKIESKFHGVVLDIDKLSSGCKTILNVMYYSDKVFCIKECGSNAIDILYSLEYGNVYSDYPIISFDMDKVKIYEKGRASEMDDYEALKEWWNHA